MPTDETPAKPDLPLSESHGSGPASAPPADADFVPDLDAVRALWQRGDQPPIDSLADAFRVFVDLGKQGSLAADTHLFGDELVVVPWDDGDAATTADGWRIGRGDGEIAGHFPPGAIGYAVKHHRPAHRSLGPDDAGSSLKEHLKLQDTHIELVVGVERDGEPGAISLNNPQEYQGGRFGNADYPMIFVRPAWPEFVDAERAAAYAANIRTMMACFNTVSEFPGDYNGGDPLAAWSPSQVREHTRQMLLAVAGDEEERAAARAWFQLEENLIYCAELAHVSTSAGLLVPLNEAGCGDLVEPAVWRRFREIVAAHGRGEETVITEENRNRWVRLVELAEAPADLPPLPELAPEAERADWAGRLAFRPLTAADIIESFLRTHFPRQSLGESIAPVQAAVLQKMLPGILESTGLDRLPAGDPRRGAVEALHGQIVEVVGRQYESYEAFREALAPLMEQARQVTGPRPGAVTGEGWFVPPSTLHLIAKDLHGGGLIGLDYVGHGLHWSMMKRA